MRILLIVDSYLPEPKATGPMFQALARELIRRGHQVTLLTVSDQVAGKLSDTHEAGLRILRVRAPRLKQNSLNHISLARRALNELLLSNLVWARAGPALASVRAELIVFYSPTIFWGPLVRRLKRLWHARAVLVVRDIFPQWALDAGQIRPGPHYRLFEHYARLQYRAADRIGVQSPNNLAYFREHLPQLLPKIGVLFNWTSNDAPEPPASRLQLGIPERATILLYGGNLGVAQDAALLLETARRLRAFDAIVLVVGEGTATPQLAAAIRDERLTNLMFLPSLPPDRFLEIARACDVGLIALNPKLTTHNFPGKLLTYISAELPILASVNRGNDLHDILEASAAGIATWADEPETFYSAATYLVEQTAVRAMMRSQVKDRLAPVFSVANAADFILAT